MAKVVNIKSKNKAGKAKSNKETATGKNEPVKKGRFGRPADGSAPKSKAKGKSKSKKKAITYKAPADVKSFFLETEFGTSHDGLLSPDDLMLLAVKGSINNENAPRYDLVELDPATAVAAFARMQYKLFAANPEKRLPPNERFYAVLRVSVTKDGLLRAGVKTLIHIDTSGKKPKDVELTADFKDKNDWRAQARRKFRACGRYLAGAFVSVKSMAELKELDRELAARQAEDEPDEDEDD